MDRLIEAVNTHLATSRNYDVIHAHTNDERDIDIAFIYDTTLLDVPYPNLDPADPLKQSVFWHVVMRRHATREILQVNFVTKTPDRHIWALFGNHWPSRSGGSPANSAGYRAIAGETLGYWHERVLQVHGAGTPVLVMGDLNDEAFDSSLVKHAGSTRQRAKVMTAKEGPRLWNLMWPLMGRPDGSYYYDNEPNMFDQFLVNRNMASDTSPLKAAPGVRGAAQSTQHR